MKTKSVLIALAIFLLSSISAFAEVMLFVGEGCSHCQKVEEYLEENDFYEKFQIQIYEIYNDKENLLLYVEKSRELDYKNGLVPLLVNGNEYVDGATAIIEYLEKLANRENKKNNTTDAGEKSTLSKEEADQLNQLIKTEVKKDATENNKANKTQTDSIQTKSIGIIVIIFGLTLFSTMIYRARRKK